MKQTPIQLLPMGYSKILSNIKSFSKKFSASSTLFLCCTLFILNFCFAIPLLLKPMDTEADAYGRAMVFPFTESGIFAMDGNVWLPLYETFMSATQFLPGERMMVPRYAALFMASLVPIFIFLLTKRVTKHTGISFVTAVIYILFPLFREIGTATFSETLFLALFLGALYSLLNERYLTFGWLLLLSQMTRFEAWFAIPWLVAILALHKKILLPSKIILILFCIAFPLLYSGISYLSNGKGAGYAHEMETMAKTQYVEGQNNFPVAVARWVTKSREVVPLSFICLFAIGAVIFLREKKARKFDESLDQFVFVILPLFLLLMLPIQLFLPFRDWLPHRYFLIPITLLFPLIGKGLQFLLFTYDWRRFWQWYVLIPLFVGFEFYSLFLNTHSLLPTYNSVQFQEIYQTLEYSVKPILLSDPSAKVYVNNLEEFDEEVTVLDLGIVRYFLLPASIYQVEYATKDRLPEVINNGRHKKIVITPTKQMLPNDLPLKILFQGQNYSFYISR